MNNFVKTFLAGLLLICISRVKAQLVDAEWQPMSFPNLPPAVRVYEANTTFPNGDPLHATYAVIDLKDPNIELLIDHNHPDGPRITPQQYAYRQDEPVYLASNGAFFNRTGRSDNLMIQDGELIARGREGIVRTSKVTGRDTTYYATWAAWGLLPDGSQEIVWTWPGGSADDQFAIRFSEPYPNSRNELPLPVPTLKGYRDDTTNIVGSIWDAQMATGGTPALVVNGKIRVAEEELINCPGLCGKNPRTAIGYTAEGHFIIMVVDWRQAELSVGATLPELAEMMLVVGCVGAINVDGGGSSVMIADQNQVITNPSDAQGMRAVGSALLIKRRPQIFDTENLAVYAEMGGWSQSSNDGFYGTSNTRLSTTGDGSEFAYYVLPDDFSPAVYELSAWWVGASDHSSTTPYLIKRHGFPADTIRLDQTLNSGAFNLVGTFDFGPNDTILISNATPTGDLVAVDAVRLRKVGESTPTITFAGESSADYLNGETATIEAAFESPNAGVTLHTLRIFKQVNGDPEAQLGSDIALNGSTSDAYTLDIQVVENAGDSVRLRFELEESRGLTVSKTYSIRVTPFSIDFDPDLSAGEHHSGRNLAFDVIVNTQNRAVAVSTIKVYQSLYGQGEDLIDIITPNTTEVTYHFDYLITEEPGNVLTYRFRVETDDGETLDKTYLAAVTRAKGNIRVAFINDINSSFGSTGYNLSVQQSVEFIAERSGADLVILVGDLIAGQSDALTRENVKAMWASFDQMIKTPLDKAGIPIGVGLGNHDADPNVPIDREEAEIYWNNNKPAITYVDDTNFPFYHAFVAAGGDLFCIALDGVNASNTDDEALAWVEQVLQTPESQNARYRFIFSHLPLFASNNRYNEPGGILNKNYELLALCRQYDVQTFVGAHHAAYYPGKRRGIDCLNLGEQARAGEALTNTGIPTPTSTTIIDIYEDDPFFGDSLVYTTFDLFNDFRVVPYEESPNGVFSLDGHLIRRDKEIFSSGTTILSGLNLPESNSSTAKATAEARLANGQIEIAGFFADLEGRILASEAAAAVYTGLNGQQGVLKYPLAVSSVDGKNGTFSGTVAFDPDFAELMSIGYYHVVIKTEAYPQGELRGQLYPTKNEGPTAPTFTSHRPEEIFPVRDVRALYNVNWTPGTDSDQDRLTYIYQLARDAAFDDILVSRSTGIDTSFKHLTEGEWYTFLGEKIPGETGTLYHRVIATDGSNQTVGSATLLQLTKDDSPVTEPVEIPAPNYKYEGVFAYLPGFRIYDVAIDEMTGRVWTTTYSSPAGFQVFNKDGSPYLLTDPHLVYDSAHVVAINYQGRKYELAPCYGIEWSAIDNTIIVAGKGLWKLNAETGKVIAFAKEEPGSNPSVDNRGRIFYHQVYPARGAHIIQQSSSDPTTFDIVSAPALDAGPNVARTSAMAPEGNVLYLPDAAAARQVYIYTSHDGVHFEFSEIFDMPAATGSNAIVAGPDSTFYVINNRGEQPPRLIFVDQKQQLRWDYLLEEVPDNDIRGFTISADARTFYLGGEGNQLYKYVLESK